MPVQWVVLPTDALIYALLLVVFAFGAYAARHEYLRAPWRDVARRPMAMASAVVLLAYVTVGLLDSVHFHPRLDEPGRQAPVYSPQILSLLDDLVTPLRTHVEVSYSAPFAVYGYSKQTVEYPDGRRVRAYPRLRYGGAYLRDARQRGADIARKVLAATAVAAFAWSVLVAAFVFAWRGDRPWARAWRDLARGRTDVPWRTVLITAGVLMLLAANLGYLSLYYHVCGTDQVGEDVLFKSLKSVRTGLVIGTLTTLMMLPFAVVLGILAGYFRGWVDDVIQYTYTTLSSIPGVLLIAAAILSLEAYMANHPASFDNITARADTRLLFLCLILGVTSWTGLCRLLRGETLKLRQADYVEAARSLGVRDTAIMMRHILPNVMHLVLITVTLDFSNMVLAEAVLSYVGVGVDPTMNSWGNMINSARLEMARDPIVWWNLASAFVFMLGLVLAANLFADAVRDAFDPRARRIARAGADGGAA